MSWLYESRRIITQHNGTLSLKRFLGRWELRSKDLTQQSSPYMDALWRKTLRAAARYDVSVRRCLVLGVGLGGIFQQVRSSYPLAEIVAVDWDRELIELGKTLGIVPVDARMQIITGDVADVVPRLGGVFDLVIIDLFTGKHLAPILYEPSFRDVLMQKVTAGGVVCLNGYLEKKVFEVWKPSALQTQTVRYQMNDILICSSVIPDRDPGPSHLSVIPASEPESKK